MSVERRRFEVLFPRHFNDGREVPPEWVTEAVYEMVLHLGAASRETHAVDGYFRRGGYVFQDELVRLVVDVPDSAENRDWMARFRDRWKDRLEQLDVWMTSYPVRIE